MKLIKDPIHGYVTLSDEEVKILDTYPVQRLRRITQLPFVYLVYPGARHTRFDHSLGCFHLAGELADHLGLDEYEAKVLRIASLLHDVGHMPYSHLLESLLLRSNLNHEDISIRVITYSAELRDAIGEVGVDARSVIDVLSGKSMLSPLVSGPLDVDRLDFLVRDAYFTGATYGIVDIKRIIRLTKLTDEGPSLDVKGWGVLEELALARYHSFLNIYFHHTVRAAQVMFLRGAEVVSEELGIDFASMSVDEYLSYDDYSMWCLMRTHPKGRSVIERIERRVLPRMVYESRLYDEAKVKHLTDKRREIEREISELSGVEVEKVYVDSSYAPPLLKYGPSMIKLHSGDRRVDEFSSGILEFVSRQFSIVRVYVDREVKDFKKVADASKSLLG